MDFTRASRTQNLIGAYLSHLKQAYKTPCSNGGNLIVFFPFYQFIISETSIVCPEMKRLESRTYTKV